MGAPATIRLSVEGTQEAASRLDDLGRQIVKQQQLVNRTQNIAAQKYQSVKGSNSASQEERDAAAMYIRLTRMESEHLARLHSMKKYEQESLFQTELSNTHKRIEMTKAAREKANGQLSGGKSELSGFGGKMVMSHAAGMAAGSIIGDEHGGSEIGSVIGAFMFGGPVVAGAVAGIEYVGAAFRGYRDNVKEAGLATQGYMNTLLEISNVGKELGSSQVVRSGFGNAMSKESMRASAASMKSLEELAGMDKNAPFDQNIGAFWSGDFSKRNTGHATKRRMLGQSADANLQSSTAERIAEEMDYPKQVEDIRNVNKAEVTLLSTTAMRPGLLREELAVTREIALEDTKRAATHRAIKASAEAAVKITESERDAAFDAYKNRDKNLSGDTQAALFRKATEAATNTQDARRDAMRADAQMNQEDLQAAEVHKQKKAALDTQWKIYSDKTVHETMLANVRANFEGHAQAKRLREEEYAWEEEQAKYQGPHFLELAKAKHDWQRKEQDREDKRFLDSELAAYSPAAATAANRFKMENAKAYGATKEQLELLNIGQYRNQVELEGINILSARRDITLQEAELQRMLAADKRSQDDPQVKAEITKLAQQKNEAANAEEIKNLQISGAEAFLKMAYERHQLSVAEYELQRAILADRRAQENPAVKAQLEKTMQAKEEANVTQDIMGYRNQTAEADLRYRQMTHGMTRRDADIERMIRADRRAQSDTKEGERIRAEIVKTADAQQRMRMGEMAQVGLGTSQYAWGRINFAALNQNKLYSAFANNGQLASTGYGAGVNANELNKNIERQNLETNKLILQVLRDIKAEGVLK